MSKEREAFEFWFYPLMYDYGMEEDMWRAWQASREVSLEECTKVCLVVALPGVNEYADGYNTGAFECERRIKEILK